LTLSYFVLEATNVFLFFSINAVESKRTGAKQIDGSCHKISFNWLKTMQLAKFFVNFFGCTVALPPILSSEGWYTQMYYLFRHGRICISHFP